MLTQLHSLCWIRATDSLWLVNSVLWTCLHHHDHGMVLPDMPGKSSILTQNLWVHTANPLGPHLQDDNIFNLFSTIFDVSSYPQVLQSTFHESPSCFSFPSLSLHTAALLSDSPDPGKWTPSLLLLLLLFLVSVTTASAPGLDSRSGTAQNLLVQPALSPGRHLHLLHSTIQESPSCLWTPRSLVPQLVGTETLIISHSRYNKESNNDDIYILKILLFPSYSLYVVYKV